MTPAGDSVLSAPTTIRFENRSEGASDYQFLINGVPQPMNTPPAPVATRLGLTTIQLVAYQGACRDTAASFYFYPGHPPVSQQHATVFYGLPYRHFETFQHAALPTGGYVLPAHRALTTPFHESISGFLLKVKPKGCLEWVRRIKSGATSDLSFAQGLSDGGIAAAGTVDNNDIVMKISATGELLWAKRILPIQKRLFTRFEIAPLNDGGFVLLGSSINLDVIGIFRFDAQGALVWQACMPIETPHEFGVFSLAYRNGYVYVAATTQESRPSLIRKLDVTDGRLVWEKKYENDQDLALVCMESGPEGLLLGCMTWPDIPHYESLGGLIKMDEDGNVLQAVDLVQHYAGPEPEASVFIWVGVAQSGLNTYLLSSGYADYTNGYYSKLIQVNKQLQVNWGQVFRNRDYQFFSLRAGERNSATLAGCGRRPGEILQPSGSLALQMVDADGLSSSDACSFVPMEAQSKPLQIRVTAVPNDALFQFPPLVETASLELEPFSMEVAFECPAYVDDCNFLKLTGPREVCNSDQSYTYRAHRASTCGSHLQWKVPAGVQTLLENDSSITVRFPGSGHYVVAVSDPYSCAPTQDSIEVWVRLLTPPLSLGNDLKVCPPAPLTLRAHADFMHYVWSDGSTDSVLTVRKPGTYWVKATDYCDITVSDTVLVALSPPMQYPILPADTIFCVKGQFEIKPLLPYQRYKWSSGETTNTIVANHAGRYWLEAADYNNCVGRDTIQLTTHDCVVTCYIPNAFTPNGDGHNDIFRPLFVDKITQYQCSIFNRWGQLVFSTTDTRKGWDGNFQGKPCPTGTYTYICRFQGEGTDSETRKGMLELIR